MTNFLTFLIDTFKQATFLLKDKSMGDVDSKKTGFYIDRNPITYPANTKCRNWKFKLECDNFNKVPKIRFHCQNSLKQ